MDKQSFKEWRIKKAQCQKDLHDILSKTSNHFYEEISKNQKHKHLGLNMIISEEVLNQDIQICSAYIDFVKKRLHEELKEVDEYELICENDEIDTLVIDNYDSLNYTDFQRVSNQMMALILKDDSYINIFPTSSIFFQIFCTNMNAKFIELSWRFDLFVRRFSKLIKSEGKLECEETA